MKKQLRMLIFVMLATNQSYDAEAAAASLPFEKEGFELGLSHDEIAEIQRGYPVSEGTTLAHFYDSVLWYFQEKVIHSLKGWVTEQIDKMTFNGGDSELKGQRIATFVKALKDEEAQEQEKATTQRPTPGKLGSRLQLFEQSGGAASSSAAAVVKERRTPPPTRPKPQSSPSLSRSGLGEAIPLAGSVKKGPPPPVPPKNKKLGFREGTGVSTAPTVVPAIAVEEPAHLAPVGAQEADVEEIPVREAVTEELSGEDVAQRQAQEVLERNAQILADVSGGAEAVTNLLPSNDDEDVIVLPEDDTPSKRDEDEDIIVLDDDNTPSSNPATADDEIIVLSDDLPVAAAGAGVPVQQQVVTEASPVAVSSAGAFAEQRTEGAERGATAGRRSSHEVKERLRNAILAAAAAEKERRAVQAEADKSQALRDLQRALQSRYDLETVEHKNIEDFTSDQALQLLQDPAFQDEFLQGEIKRLMSAPGGTFDEDVLATALGTENDDFHRFVARLAFSSKTPEKRFKTDFRRFDQALPMLIRTEQETKPLLELLVKRHELFLKQWLKSLQEREHSPNLTGDQIKEDLIGRVRDGLPYSPSDRALDAFVPVLLALQESMQGLEASSETLDKLFRSAGQSIRKSLSAAQASAFETPKKQGIESVVHRIGFSKIMVQVDQNASEIREQMEKALGAKEVSEGASPGFSFNAWKNLEKIQKEKFELDIRKQAKKWIEHALRNSEGSFDHAVELTNEEKESLENKIVEVCTKEI